MNTIPKLQTLLIQYNLEDFFPKTYQKELQVKFYTKGQAICHQEEALNHLFYVLSGKLKIVRRLANGKEHILEMPRLPSIIGDIELMTSQGAVSSVIALENTLVIALPLWKKAELLRDPDFLYQIGQKLAQSLYHQNITSSTNITYTVKERLATHILTVAESDTFQLHLSILADQFGTSYRHLMRVIKQLLDAQIIDKPTFKHYRILNRQAIERLAVPESF